MNFDDMKVVPYVRSHRMHIQQAPGRARETIDTRTPLYVIRWEGCFFNYAYLDEAQATRCMEQLKRTPIEIRALFSWNFHDRPKSVAPREGPPALAKVPVRSKFF